AETLCGNRTWVRTLPACQVWQARASGVLCPARRMRAYPESNNYFGRVAETLCRNGTNAEMFAETKLPPQQGDLFIGGGCPSPSIVPAERATGMQFTGRSAGTHPCHQKGDRNEKWHRCRDSCR